jgi:sugar-specific transcriptional regulator TrmB
MVDKADNYNLSALGLTHEEGEVYLSLLAKGEQGILELSRELNIPRTTVYRICDKLVKQGLAVWSVGERGRTIAPVNTETLDHRLGEKQQELKDLEAVIVNLKALAHSSLKSEAFTSIRRYTGRKGMKQLIWNTLSSKSDIVGYSIYGRKKIIGDKFSSKVIAEAKQRGIKDRVIINKRHLKNALDALEGSPQKDYQTVRVVEDKNFYVSGDTYIYDNIYAVNFWDDNEIIGVEIQNKEIVAMQRAIFEQMWAVAGRLEDYV